MSKKLKSVPAFETEVEERAFCEANDSSEYVDWNMGKRARFLNLHLSAVNKHYSKK